MPASNPPFATIVRRYGPAAIDEAAALVRAGQPVAAPTETVYGLAADATNAEAVARIYQAKGRPSFNPLIVHTSGIDAARSFAIFDDDAAALAAHFWPGPLTLVLPRRPESPIAALATAGLGSIALRVPAHRAMRALLAASGRPLAAPSANASGAISPTRAEHVLTSLDGRIAMIVDDGATAHGLESTIVALLDGSAQILRPGPIAAAEIETAIGRRLQAATGAIVAPGMLDRHYAPGKPLALDVTDAAAGAFMIGFGDVPGHASLSQSGDLVQAAAALFDLLHQADASSMRSIAVAPVPHTGLGAAINDRLRRAAHG